ncbi:transposable element Tcb2 transposase [Trichonephila clavipes]|nr:transposable element Tcb2 transposase [Trichonephila clavipes]
MVLNDRGVKFRIITEAMRKSLRVCHILNQDSGMHKLDATVAMDHNRVRMKICTVRLAQLRRKKRRLSTINHCRRSLYSSLQPEIKRTVKTGNRKNGGGQLDGWKWDCLNVSRSVVQRLWDQYQSEDYVSRRPIPGRPRATTPAEDRFLALSARRRRTTTVPQLVADHFQASGRRISATTVRNRLHNAGRLLIWRKQRTRYHQSNTVERHSYKGGGILVWAGISLGGHTDLHVFHGGTVTGLRYRDEILDPYVRPYAAAIGNDFILMDDNARPHRAGIVEEYLEDHGMERMEWPA